jgi:beta-galactosidase/beta-glucuronidase
MAKKISQSKNSKGGERGYPRPQLQRSNWTNLNGLWNFAIDPEGQWREEGQVKWDREIVVPFAPESPASGVNDTGLYRGVWYARTFNAPVIKDGERLILHFGAVDYHAWVWVNGHLAVEHEGGYTPFRADVTDLLVEGEEQRVVVRARDNPDDLAKPRGKQDWQEKPHSIWYYRTTGIWQTVWMEVVPATHVRMLKWTSNVERWEMEVEAHLDGDQREDLYLDVKLMSGEKVLAEDRYKVDARGIHRKIELFDPGIDDYRNEFLWSPSSPRLLEAEVTLRDGEGNAIDAIKSYAAMRQITLLGNRFVLNGKPEKLMMLLDQGYWPESGLTSPDDGALKKDVELVKAMGFNGVRKHQKIEDPRFLYWADRLGLFVWEEMPSAYRFSGETVTRLTKQWTEAIARDVSHPCIVAWVPFNESWGVPDLPDSESQQHCVQALYYLTKTLDPTRPCISNDGWETVTTDIVGVHDYDADPRAVAKRYATERGTVKDLLNHERPGKKILMVDGFEYEGQPIMLTEFGGIAFSKDTAATWGYSRAKTSDDFAARYAHLLGVVRSLPILSGFCYTQFTDTYQEANGLLYMDRTPKFKIEEIANATRGPRDAEDVKAVERWRKMIEERLAKVDRESLVEAGEKRM